MPTSIIGYDYSTTLAQGRAILAQRLNDSGMVFWTSSELDFYLQEALATWNCYSRYYRCRAQANIAAGSRQHLVVNVTTPTPSAGSENPISLTVSGRKFLQGVLLHTLEVNTSTFPASASLTGHLTTTILEDALITALNDINLRTSTVGVLGAINGVIAGQSRVSINSTFSNIVRAEWQSLAGTLYHLDRVSRQEQDHFFNPFAETLGTPSSYSVQLTPALQLELTPTPNDNGKVNLIAISSQSIVGALFTTDENFSWPADWWWLVKYAMLEKLYSSDGPLNYPQMADYCRKRVSQGVEMLRTWTYIDAALANDQQLELSSVAGPDYFAPLWKSSTSATRPPRSLNMVTANIGYLDSTYSADPVSLSLEVVRDTPTVTGDDSNILPIAPEFLNCVLDYAQHLAATKMGGVEFSATLPLFESFMNGAARINDKLQANIAPFLPGPIRLKEQHKGDSFDQALAMEGGR